MSSRPQGRKLSVAVIFGGMSGEHEVSLRSARAVIAAFDTARYDVLPLKVEKDGRWYLDRSFLPDGKARGAKRSQGRVLAPSPSRGNRLLMTDGSPGEAIDIAFPLVHGTGGEDGTLQGLLELAQVPYCGAGVIGSSVGMDKDVQKALLKAAGIPVTDHLTFLASEWREGQRGIRAEIAKTLGFPVFVKPANLGSSVGISKVHHGKELVQAMDAAFDFDTKVIVERAVPKARELECAVIGNETPEVASVIGEVLPSNEFYDYDAKYVDERSVTVLPAPLPPATSRKIRDMAATTYRTLQTRGYARVDFLVARDTNAIYVNEINTLPGFTSISMFPKLWEASGTGFTALLDRIVELGLSEAKAKRALIRDLSLRKKGRLA